jgi:hypothetical protein
MKQRLANQDYIDAIKAAAAAGDYALADAIGVEAGWGSWKACRNCGQASSEYDVIFWLNTFGLDCPGGVCQRCRLEVIQRLQF